MTRGAVIFIYSNIQQMKINEAFEEELLTFNLLQIHIFKGIPFMLMLLLVLLGYVVSV